MSLRSNHITSFGPVAGFGTIRLVRWLLVFAGVMLILSSFYPGDARWLGDGTARFLIPLAAGISSLVLGFAFGSRWQTAAFWFSVAIVGRVTALQLVNAGYQLRYQHYKPISELLSFPTIVFTVAVLFQAVIVGISAWGFWRSSQPWRKVDLPGWKVAVLAAFFFLPTTTLSENVSVYLTEWIIAGFIQALSLATVVFFALSIPEESVERVRTITDRILGRSGLGTRLAFWLASGVVILAIVLNIYAYERHPHVPDEIAYLMQARFFAAGHVTMPAPPVPEAFEVYLMKIDGARWYPVTPPGWAALLAIGTFFGLSLIVNPLLAGISILISYRLLRELYPRSTARLAIILLALSPWYIFLAMSYMTHTAALTFALAASLGVVLARKTGRPGWAFAAGLAVGMISLIRPLEAVAVGGLLGLWSIGLGGRRLRFTGIAALVLGAGLLGTAGLYYNALLTGDPLRFPLNVYTDEVFGHNSNAYGFGPDRGMGWQLDPYPGHGPIDALINSNLNVSALNTELFGWPIGAFLPIAALLCFGRLRRSDHLMFAVIAAIYGLHFFYYFSGGPDFGARYWFLMIVPLIALTVRGIKVIGEKLKAIGVSASGRLHAAVAALCLINLFIFIPWRAADKYLNFRGMRPDVRRLADTYEFGRSLVLVQGNKHPDFDSAFIYNPLDLDIDAPIYAWDRDETTRRKLLTYYADRPVWIVKSPSITGKGYEVAAGPLTAAEIRNIDAN